MGESNTSSGTGATPIPDTGATPTTASQGATPQKLLPATLEEAHRELEELRRHAANKEEQASRHGKSLTAVEKELAAYKDKERADQEAQLNESQKLAKRLQETEQKALTYQKELITSQVREAAHRLGVIDPEMAALAVEKSLEYGDDGMPTNVDKALEVLIKNKPYLIKKAEADASPPPAQSSTVPQSPVIPAMNPPTPGRSTIPSPNSSPSGRPRIPTWDEVYRSGNK